ncbi:MAG: hypothetical protein KDM91_05635 [Verrucomicrobiae bacterium]|nr:hypothetical protein [Verrucomicrobiae bacterium]
MSTLAEIEAAIEKLPEPQVNQLVRWLEARGRAHSLPTLVDDWLSVARGAALAEATTDELLQTTRGEV